MQWRGVSIAPVGARASAKSQLQSESFAISLDLIRTPSTRRLAQILVADCAVREPKIGVGAASRPARLDPPIRIDSAGRATGTLIWKGAYENAVRLDNAVFDVRAVADAF